MMIVPSTTPRLNDGVLQPIERPILRWLVQRIPDSIGPDALSLFGIFGAALAFIAYAGSRWQIDWLWLASLGLVINWLGDSLDGTLARYRKIERPKYGFFVDQGADIVCQLLIGFGIGLCPFVRFDVACIGLVAYLVLASLTLVRRCALGTMQICHGRMGPTELRVALIALNTSWLFYEPHRLHTMFGTFSLADVAILAASCVAFLGFAYSSLKEAKALRVQDPAIRRPLFHLLADEESRSVPHPGALLSRQSLDQLEAEA